MSCSGLETESSPGAWLAGLQGFCGALVPPYSPFYPFSTEMSVAGTLRLSHHCTSGVSEAYDLSRFRSRQTERSRIRRASLTFGLGSHEVQESGETV